MDLVSIETREENEFLKQRMINGLIRFFWTSGRKCNFAGCEREDLQPSIVNGNDFPFILRVFFSIILEVFFSPKRSLISRTKT